MNGRLRTCEQMLVAGLETALQAFGQYAAMNFLGPWYYADEAAREVPPPADTPLNDTQHTGTAS